MLVLLKSALDALKPVRQHPADERVVPILLPGRAQHRNAVDVRPHFDVQERRVLAGDVEFRHQEVHQHGDVLRVAAVILPAAVAHVEQVEEVRLVSGEADVRRADGFVGRIGGIADKISAVSTVLCVRGINCGGKQVVHARKGAENHLGGRMQGIGNRAGGDGIEAALAGKSAGGRHEASPFDNMRCATCVAIVANKIPCVKGKFAIYSCFFSKASHFLHADVMLGG